MLPPGKRTMVGVMGVIKGLAAGSISLSLEFHRLLPAKRRFCPNRSGFTGLTVTAAFTVIPASSSCAPAGVPLATIRNIRSISRRQVRSNIWRFPKNNVKNGVPGGASGGGIHRLPRSSRASWRTWDNRSPWISQVQWFSMVCRALAPSWRRSSLCSINSRSWCAMVS